MHAEDVKRWLRGKGKEEENPDTHKDAGVKWNVFVELIKEI